MNLEQLTALGAFVSKEPVKRSVTWVRTVDGEEKSDTFDVYVKRMSFGDVERLFLVEDEKRSKMARYLSECLLLGEEKTPITYEQAYRLDVSFARVLTDAVGEVNGTVQAEKK